MGLRIVISGTSNGIGRALATRLVSRGHEVHGLARSDQASIEQQLGPAFHGIRCDVSSVGDVAAAVAAVQKRWTAIEAVITCAGVQGIVGRAMTVDPVEWCSTVRANLEGTYLTVRGFWPLIAQAERHSKVICFSGGGATKSRPHFSAYGAAKTALVRLVETIAEEERSGKVDINAVAPGAINTRMTDELIALGPVRAGQAEYEAALAQKSRGDGAMARALDLVEWLLSENSDGVSGRLISAPWDPWQHLGDKRSQLASNDVYMLRRIIPSDRGLTWG